MSYCRRCEKLLPSDGAFVLCSGCDGSLHFECTTLAAKTYAGMGSERKTNWRCETCRLALKVADTIRAKISSTEFSVLVEPLQDSINKINENLTKCCESQVFISQQYDDFCRKINGLTDKVVNIEKNVKQLMELEKDNETVMKNLNKRINQLEQEKYDADIVIHGVDERNNEDLYTLVQDIAERVKVKCGKADIVNIERMSAANRNISREAGTGATERRARPISCTFKTAKIRNEILKNKKSTIVKCSDILENGSNKIVRVYEKLSQNLMKLMYSTRQKAVAANYKYVWYAGGAVRCRKRDGSNVLFIDSEKDLEKIT